MLTVAIPKRNKLQNIIVLTPKDGYAERIDAVYYIEIDKYFQLKKYKITEQKPLFM